MAAKGRAHISVKVQAPLAIIWEELEYLANTLIFILAGVLIAGNIYASSVSGPSHIEGLDYVYALLLWVYLLVRNLCMQPAACLPSAPSCLAIEVQIPLSLCQLHDDVCF